MARVQKPRTKKGVNPFCRHCQAYSEEEHKALRHYTEKHKHLDQKELALWFLHQFSKKISQSTISESLSDKFAHVDNLKFKEKDVVNCRLRAGKFPELDRVLFEFQQTMQKAKLPITGDILKAASE